MGAQRWLAEAEFDGYAPVRLDLVTGANELVLTGESYVLGPFEQVVLAADYDRDVVEAETRGWNAGLALWISNIEAQIERKFADYPDCIGAKVLRDHIASIAALRKPEVEG